ncbi:MAG: CPXCG motif-containing cysteine-rich protein [Mariprofundaceae bacterium]
MRVEPLAYPIFICQTCGTKNTLEIDRSEGFPQSFIWDCECCCHAHDISVREHAGNHLEIIAESV